MYRKQEERSLTNCLITQNHPRIIAFFKSLDKVLDSLERCIEKRKLTLNGELYLTDKEVSERLKINRRTLFQYRNEGLISFYQVGGKILYKESDIQKMLDFNYRKSFM